MSQSQQTVTIPITGTGLARLFEAVPKHGYNDAFRICAKFFDDAGNQISEGCFNVASVIVQRDEQGNITEAYAVFNVDGPNQPVARVRINLQIHIAREYNPSAYHVWMPFTDDIDIVPPASSFSLKLWLVKPG